MTTATEKKKREKSTAKHATEQRYSVATGRTRKYFNTCPGARMSMYMRLYHGNTCQRSSESRVQWSLAEAKTSFKLYEDFFCLFVSLFCFLFIIGVLSEVTLTLKKCVRFLLQGLHPNFGNWKYVFVEMSKLFIPPICFGTCSMKASWPFSRAGLYHLNPFIYLPEVKTWKTDRWCEYLHKI